MFPDELLARPKTHTDILSTVMWSARNIFELLLIHAAINLSHAVEPERDRDTDHGVATSKKQSFQIEKGQINNRATQTIHFIQFQTGKEHGKK